MLTPTDALLVEYKALKCLKEGRENSGVAQAARRFAWRAVKCLVEGGYCHEAEHVKRGIFKENVIDNNDR